ncbi:MAG: endonuclease MutS2 [Bacillota bacterium]|jgi:DNA mismatch repair protein MutS2
MDIKVLKKLEYNKIIGHLADLTSFAYGQELAEKLLPASNSTEAAQRQQETNEAKEILRFYPTFSLGPVRDIRDHLRHITIGGILDAESLVDIADTCRAARLNKIFFSDIKGSYPLVASCGKGLTVIKTIETAIEKAIGTDNSINDEASPKLYSIRKKIKIANERVKERLDNLIKSPNTQKYLQEPIVTIRDNRYVVPVRQEYRAQMPGIVHDISASGASVFVEPMAVMELNNELQKLAREEAEEINAILRALTMVVCSFADELEANLVKLARLDFIFAKARYSGEINGMSPRINDNGVIKLVAARHPLIPADKVVPIDVLLDKNIAAMVITGPNTGGKTVTLKTIGLVTLMALAGLHIPVDTGSEISFFREIFADIGDEQSIEQSLSTFSSHMVNIVDILKRCDDNTLVLLDELGAGTDPTEGAALAMAILSDLKKKGCKIIATTHYSELKAFAYNNPGFINASVEFDVESLSPTYKLLMGVPGKSNAFEISQRLGLPQDIIEKAADLLSTEDAQIADLLANLEQLRQEVAAEKAEVQALGQTLAMKEKELDKAKAAVSIKEAEIIRAANLKAQAIVEETQQKSQKIYQEMIAKMVEEKAVEKAFQESKKRFKTWQEELTEQLPKKIYEGQPPTKLSVGQTVYIPSLQQKGYVLSLPDANGEVALQVGILKMMVNISELRLAQDMADTKDISKKYSGKMHMEKARQIKTEIDLRGYECQEALEVLDKYIDDLFVAGRKQARIIHGKGTGALRAAITKYLQKHRLVKSFQAGGYYEGGIGVTIIELDL